jgi:hypothetical protein
MQILLARHPVGEPTQRDFHFEYTSIPTEGTGQVLIRTLYLSLDPYMRGRMRAGPSYATGLEVGDVITGEVVGEVISSKSTDFSVGDIVNANIGWQAYGVADSNVVRAVDPTLAPVSTSLGILGMPGCTAYCGLLNVGQPKAGETVVVSAASGAVGALVGQIALIKGCRVVGIAGSDAKCSYIRDELGLDASINYKTQDLDEALSAACPAGIDVYFDNVGGIVIDAVMNYINVGARIAVCGAISDYNRDIPDSGPRVSRTLVFKQAKMEGFLVTQFRDQHQECRNQMAAWMRAGQIVYKEDFADGLENAPRAFIGLLRGENFGKLIVQVGTDDVSNG